MLNLGKVKPGSTIYIPFDTFDGGTGASLTMTGLAVTDIEVYKDGGTTQRASDSGYTLLDTDGIDFDGITGIHGFSIDLSDNTTANFYEAGSRYFVVVSSITVDSQTVSFVAATFEIGYEGAILDTTIATLSSQTSFTLEDGSADNDAYNGCVAFVHDLASAIQVAIGFVSDYVGATKTVTLAADPGIFTMAAGDNISFFPPSQVGSWNNVPLATTNPLPNAAPDSSGGLATEDASGHLAVDVREWLGSAVTLSSGNLPDINVAEVDDSSVAANNFKDWLLAWVDSSVNDGSATSTSFVTNLTETTNDHYKHHMIVFTNGALQGQARRIDGYNGTSKAVTVAPAFTEAPADTNTFLVVPVVLAAMESDGMVAADVQEVSGDATAADNVEADYDGTGYNKSNSTIGTTTTNTDMRGTDNAALASVLGALTDAAAAGDPTTADTVMQYVKQLVNVLVGSAGIATFPAEAVPQDGVNLAEVIRAIYADADSLDSNKIPGGNVLSLANIQTEVESALEDAGQVLVITTIATLSSQTSFTLSAGSADDDAYNGSIIVVEDVSTAAQKAIGIIQDYTGLTKTVTLAADPGVFTMAATDKVAILPKTGVYGWLGEVVNALVSGRVDADIGAKTGNVALSAQEKLDVNTEVDNALDTDVPASPTSGSINERVKTMDDADIPGRLPTALVGGRIDATVDGTGMETGAIDAILQRQITESYNTDGTAPTVEQALMGIMQALTEFAISGTTITVKQLDGSTTAMTFTLDDGTNPTSRTRAT